jgi:hypothetical protein
MSCVQGLGVIEPQLPSHVDQPPEAADWIHEIKDGGYRTILVLDRGDGRAFTRNGFHCSDRYWPIVHLVRDLKRKQRLGGLFLRMMIEFLMAKPLKLQIIQTAKELIQNERHWCRGYLATDDYGLSVDPAGPDAVKR